MEVSGGVPLRARVTSRLRALVVDAVIGAHGVSWWTVQNTVSAAAEVLNGLFGLPRGAGR